VLDRSPGLARFIESMPVDYATSYTDQAIEQHRRVCERRGQLVVDAGMFEQRGGLLGICIVATDRPGLLAIITEAFLVCGMDVVSGDAFTRDLGDGKEAVDLFWVRPVHGVNGNADAEVDKLRTSLQGLLSSYATPLPALVGLPTSISSNSTVRFIEDANGALCTLEVETEDRSGLLLSLSRALHAQKVQIVRSEVRTKGGRVLDRFVITEVDGSPVAPMRRLEIQVAVLSAAEPAKRLTSSPPPPVA
jgi:UTP:GlnB (protein PII) uridylyltransferase